MQTERKIVDPVQVKMKKYELERLVNKHCISSQTEMFGRCKRWFYWSSPYLGESCKNIVATWKSGGIATIPSKWVD
jgi:hypothetical protein